MVKQLAKLVKVRYVEDITHSERVGAALHICSDSEMPTEVMHQQVHRQHVQQAAQSSAI